MGGVGFRAWDYGRGILGLGPIFAVIEGSGCEYVCALGWGRRLLEQPRVCAAWDSGRVIWGRGLFSRTLRVRGLGLRFWGSGLRV